MVTLNHPNRPRRAFARAVTTANQTKGTTMQNDTATHAHRIIVAALNATWYRDNVDDALAVAHTPAGTVVIERTTYALSGNVEVQVTIQRADGEVWALARWYEDDAYQMLTETIGFITRHTPTATASAEVAA